MTMIDQQRQATPSPGSDDEAVVLDFQSQLTRPASAGIQPVRRALSKAQHPHDAVDGDGALEPGGTEIGVGQTHHVGDRQVQCPGSGRPFRRSVRACHD